MRQPVPFVHKLGGLFLASAVRRWMSTLDCCGALYERNSDPAHPEFVGPVIYLFWHEYIPFLITLRGNCNISLLVSRHLDAEWLAQAARHLGFGTVRGSTNRSGAAALREIFVRCRGMNLAITPDGPRGPRRQLAPGAVYLASRLGIPLVAIGLGYDRPWRLSTWDRFAVPKPFSRARGVVGPRIEVPPDIDREELELWRQQVEQHLNELTDFAENWAARGGRVEGQISGRPAAARHRIRRADLLGLAESAATERPMPALRRSAA